MHMNMKARKRPISGVIPQEPCFWNRVSQQDLGLHVTPCLALLLHGLLEIELSSSCLHNASMLPNELSCTHCASLRIKIQSPRTHGKGGQTWWLPAIPSLCRHRQGMYGEKQASCTSQKDDPQVLPKTKPQKSGERWERHMPMSASGLHTGLHHPHPILLHMGK